MTLILIVIIVATIAEIIICHFSFWLFLSLIGRVIFSLRSIGAVMKVRISWILEGVGLGLMLLWDLLFHKGAVPWKNIGIFALFAIAICICEGVDEMMFVYVTEDDEDYYADELQKQINKEQREKQRKLNKANKKRKSTKEHIKQGHRDKENLNPKSRRKTSKTKAKTKAKKAAR